MSLLKALLFGEKIETCPGISSPSPPSSPPWSSSEEAPISPAVLEAEEVLFRLWWRTLPNKTMAKENWEDELAHYGAQKRFKKPFLEALKARIQNLR